MGSLGAEFSEIFFCDLNINLYMYMVWSMADQSNVNKGKKFKTFSSKSFVKNLPGLVFL